MNSLSILLINLIFIYSSVVALPTLNHIKININTIDYSNIPEIKNSISQKFVKTDDEEFQLAYKKCNESSIEYDTCFPIFTPDMKDLDDLCSNSRTSQCQEYAKKGLSMIKECQVDVLKDFVNMYNGLINFVSFNFILTCATDESGKYCPLNGQILDEMKDAMNGNPPTMEVKEKKYYQNVQDTCKSKSCVDAFVTYYENRDKENEKFFETVINNPNNPYGDELSNDFPNTFSSGFNGNFNGSNNSQYFNSNNHLSERSFSIENYKNFDLNNYINATLTYFKTDECKNMSKEQIEQSNNIDNSSSSILHYSINIANIILITIAIILFTLI